MKINNLIIKPVLTEKATELAKVNTYMFVVNMKANKHQIANVLEDIYKIKVAKVSLNIRKGKMKKAGKMRREKKQPDHKIAFVTVKEGKIDVFPSA